MRIISAIVFLSRRCRPCFRHMLTSIGAAVGSAVTPAPKEVVLWFTNQLEPAFSSIEVRDEKGASVQAGKAVVDRGGRTRMSVPLKALPPGTYKVMWRILSVDTHRTQGDFTFASVRRAEGASSWPIR